jgi:hypothetical protein
MTFNYFYIGIWSLYKIWGCVGSSSHTHSWNFLGSIHFHLGMWTMFQGFLWNFTQSHYYLKDLKWVYYPCHGLPYGKKHQTLLTDDEPNKVFQNPKWSGLFLNSFKEQMLSNDKVQWLDLASCLWPPLVELPLAKMV